MLDFAFALHVYHPLYVIGIDREEILMGKITYCIIDETDPFDEFECEGEVIKTFFSTSPVFDFRNSLELIRPRIDIENKLKNTHKKLFNILHFAAHGAYFMKTKRTLDYSVIYQKRGKREKEIFRPDTIVRAELQADVFLSTCCQTFNNYFIEMIKGYKNIHNFIAPKDIPPSRRYSYIFFDVL